jgi:predicted transposase/invertase (TIGR01784 family)
VDPRNLDDKIVEIYGHKLVFLNHYYRDENTPPNYRDWLDLIYESIHNPKDYHVNLNHQGIKKVVELIEYDRLSPEQLHQMKVDAQRKVVRKIDEDKAREEGREEGKVETAKNMLKKGFEIDLIVELTGLKPKEIEKLIN